MNARRLWRALVNLLLAWWKIARARSSSACDCMFAAIHSSRVSGYVVVILLYESCRGLCRCFHVTLSVG